MPRSLPQFIARTVSMMPLTNLTSWSISATPVPWSRMPVISVRSCSRSASVAPEVGSSSSGGVPAGCRPFYGSQYAMVAPLLQHYGVQLWMPAAGGKVDFASEHDERAMTGLGLSSKREVTQTSIRVRTAMATQTREQGRYLGGRPPYGYRLGGAGPHPNKAHAGGTQVGPALDDIAEDRFGGLPRIAGLRGARCATLLDLATQ